jgi:hypothetical protein
LLPLDDAERKSTRRVRLTRAGLLKAGRGKLPKLLQSPPEGEPIGAGVLAALLAERGDNGTDR